MSTQVIFHWLIQINLIWDQYILKELQLNLQRIRKIQSLLIVIFAVEICLASAEATTRMNTTYGCRMMELHIRTTDTKHGFTFQLTECPMESNWLLHLKIWTIKLNYTAKGWNLYLEWCLALRKNGDEYLQMWTTFSIKRINSSLDFRTCSLLSQMKLLTLHFRYLTVTRIIKTRWMILRNHLNPQTQL